MSTISDRGMIRNAIAVAVVPLVALGAAACGGGNKPLDAETGYIKMLQVTGAQLPSRATLLAEGRQICRYLDNGLSPAYIAITSPYPSDYANWQVMAATEYLCPRHKEKTNP